MMKILLLLHCRQIPTTQGMSNIGCVQLVFSETCTKNLDQSKAEVSTSHHLSKFESREELQPIKMLTELTVL